MTGQAFANDDMAGEEGTQNQGGSQEGSRERNYERGEHGTLRERIDRPESRREVDRVGGPARSRILERNEIRDRPVRDNQTSDAEKARKATEARAREAAVSRSGAVGTAGVIYGYSAALGVGVAADVGSHYRFGSGLEESASVSAFAGPIISVPLPIHAPSFAIGLSAPPSDGQRVDPVDCSVFGMVTTPIMSLQYSVDPQSFEFKSVTLTVQLAIQIGAAAGMQCGFGFR